MKAKKTILAVGALLLATAAMTGCENGGTNDKPAAIKDAETLTYAQLVEKAKEEVGNNEVLTFGNSSQLEKALAKFTADTGIKVKNTKDGDAGFTSVMIDASKEVFEINLEKTKKVVQYAHEKGASVESELGRVGGQEDFIVAESAYAIPEECAQMVKETGIDALAHGTQGPLLRPQSTRNHDRPPTQRVHRTTKTPRSSRRQYV